MTELPSGGLIRLLDRYRHPSISRGLFELAITAAALIGIWAIAFLVFHLGFWWIALMLTIPAGMFLVRLFMIQHDCGHGSFMPSKVANDWIGRVLGIFTLTPYDYWRQAHAMHHATAGNLDRRNNMGDIMTLTVDEYLALPWYGRLGYRLYRNPLVMFGLGPFYNFFLLQRLPIGMMKDGWRPWVSTMGTTAGIALFLGLLIWAFGPAPALLVTLPTMLVAATIGVWLFFVQHQFEEVEWARHGEWKREEMALSGSSFYDLPQPLPWLTGNIGIHHVHHLSARIPFYRLPQVLKDLPHLADVSRISLLESFKCVRLAVWDEANGRLISFGAMKRALAGRQAAQGLT